MRLILKFVLLLFIVSCSTSEKNIDSYEVNTKLNLQYRKSRDGKFGKINKEDLNAFYTTLQKELNVTVDTSKVLLINFMQKGRNCISQSLDPKIITNIEGISNRMANNYNASDLFVYTKESYIYPLEKSEAWILDNGFVKANIFPSDQNCQGFFIIRPDGKFYKYYGEDYFSVVKRLLESQYWDF